MRGIGLVSALAGLAFGVIGFVLLKILQIEDALLLSIVSGLVFGAAFYPCLLIYGSVIDRRYRKFEKNMLSPVLYKTMGNFPMPDQKNRTGMVYVCEDGLAFALMEEKPYLWDKMLRENVEYINHTPQQLLIVTKQGQRMTVNVPNAEEVMAALQKNGWLL